MRIASSVTASVQQTQIRDRNYEKNIESKQKEENIISLTDKSHADRIAQIKDDIKNGIYKIDLAATSEKMAHNLLNL